MNKIQSLYYYSQPCCGITKQQGFFFFSQYLCYSVLLPTVSTAVHISLNYALILYYLQPKIITRGIYVTPQTNFRNEVRCVFFFFGALDFIAAKKWLLLLDVQLISWRWKCRKKVSSIQYALLSHQHTL